MTGPVIELKSVERHYVQGQRKLTILSGARLHAGGAREMVALVAPFRRRQVDAAASGRAAGAGPTPGDVILERGAPAGVSPTTRRTSIRRNDIGFVYQFHHPVAPSSRRSKTS